MFLESKLIEVQVTKMFFLKKSHIAYSYPIQVLKHNTDLKKKKQQQRNVSFLHTSGCWVTDSHTWLFSRFDRPDGWSYTLTWMFLISAALCFCRHWQLYVPLNYFCTRWKTREVISLSNRPIYDERPPTQGHATNQSNRITWVKRTCEHSEYFLEV